MAKEPSAEGCTSPSGAFRVMIKLGSITISNGNSNYETEWKRMADLMVSSYRGKLCGHFGATSVGRGVLDQKIEGV